MPFLETRDIPIYYETKGSGDAIIFAHGAGGNAAIWFNQVAYFAESYQVVAFDHRTFGRTPVPASELTVQDFRDDLLALMDTLDIEKAHLVGQSMGGFTCLRTTLDAPARVRTLTLSATSGGIYNPAPSDAIKNLTSTDNVAGVKATMSEETKTKPDMMQLYESVNNFNVHFSWSNLATLLGRDGVVQHDSLANINTPCLFIAGQEDPLFPAETLSSFVPHFGNARIEIVANAGHSPYFEQPDHFNSILEQHIKQ